MRAQASGGGRGFGGDVAEGMSEWMLRPMVGDVVDVLAGDAPDDLADVALGPEASEAGEGRGVDFFIAGELGDVVEGGAVGVGEEGLVA